MESTELFRPATLGPRTLRNRVIKAATLEGRTPHGLVTDELIAFHRAVAAGGVAMTTVAYCAVSPEGRTERRQIHLRPEAVPGLTRLAEAVHAEGAMVSAQLGHAGPVADARSNRLPALSASRRLSPLTGRFIRAATTDDLERIVAAHAYAARLTPRLNRRGDRWGGSLPNRARLARRVAEAVRAEVGDAIAVTAKLNMEDGVRGGLTIDDSLLAARLLQADGHLDALALTAGGSLLNPMYLFRGRPPVQELADAFPQPLRAGLKVFGRGFLRNYPYAPAYLLPAARRFRAALTMPLILLGGITDHAHMRQAMAEGFQFVAMGRALLMEPDLIERIRRDSSTVSLCTHCNRCVPTIYGGTHCVLTASAEQRSGQPPG
jgi:2,4-dienoyl-CoA reductase-like NADH-dependent reductase (Old Yellow Enzyme family)